MSFTDKMRVLFPDEYGGMSDEEIRESYRNEHGLEGMSDRRFRMRVGELKPPSAGQTARRMLQAFGSEGAFNFTDEAAGVVGGGLDVLDSLPSTLLSAGSVSEKAKKLSETYKKGYKETAGIARDELRAFAEDNPGLNVAARLGGAITTGGALGGIAKNAVGRLAAAETAAAARGAQMAPAARQLTAVAGQAPRAARVGRLEGAAGAALSRAPRMARAADAVLNPRSLAGLAALGAGEGALSGLGTGEGEDRFRNAAIQGLGGMAGASLVGGGGAALGRLGGVASAAGAATRGAASKLGAKLPPAGRGWRNNAADAWRFGYTNLANNLERFGEKNYSGFAESMGVGEGMGEILRSIPTLDVPRAMSGVYRILGAVFLKKRMEWIQRMVASASPKVRSLGKKFEDWLRKGQFGKAADAAQEAAREDPNVRQTWEKTKEEARRAAEGMSEADWKRAAEDAEWWPDSAGRPPWEDVAEEAAEEAGSQVWESPPGASAPPRMLGPGGAPPPDVGGGPGGGGGPRPPAPPQFEGDQAMLPGFEAGPPPRPPTQFEGDQAMLPGIEARAAPPAPRTLDEGQDVLPGLEDDVPGWTAPNPDDETLDNVQFLEKWASHPRVSRGTPEFVFRDGPRETNRAIRTIFERDIPKEDLAALIGAPADAKITITVSDPGPRPALNIFSEAKLPNGYVQQIDRRIRRDGDGVLRVNNAHQIINNPETGDFGRSGLSTPLVARQLLALRKYDGVADALAAQGGRYSGFKVWPRAGFVHGDMGMGRYGGPEAFADRMATQPEFVTRYLEEANSSLEVRADPRGPIESNRTLAAFRNGRRRGPKQVEEARRAREPDNRQVTTEDVQNRTFERWANADPERVAAAYRNARRNAEDKSLSERARQGGRRVMREIELATGMSVDGVPPGLLDDVDDVALTPRRPDTSNMRGDIAAGLNNLTEPLRVANLRGTGEKEAFERVYRTLKFLEDQAARQVAARDTAPMRSALKEELRYWAAKLRLSLAEVDPDNLLSSGAV